MKNVKTGKDEFVKIVAVLKSNYPSFKNYFVNETEINIAYNMLNEFEPEIIENAVAKLCCISEFPPTAKALRLECQKIKGLNNFPTPEEAWTTVTDCIIKIGTGHDDDGREKWEKVKTCFDEITCSVVKEMGWSNLCGSNNSYDDHNRFIRLYKDKLEQQQTIAAIPQNIRAEEQRLIDKYVDNDVALLEDK